MKTTNLTKILVKYPRLPHEQMEIRKELEALISKEVTLGKLGLLESILQASTVANSPAFNPLSGVGRIEIEDLIKELRATLMEEES